jgi:hypothetical protein
MDARHPVVAAPFLLALIHSGGKVTHGLSTSKDVQNEAAADMSLASQHSPDYIKKIIAQGEKK